MRAHYRQRARGSVPLALDSVAAEKRAGVIGPLVSFGFCHHSFNIRSRQSKSSLPVIVADADVEHLSGAQREGNEMMKHCPVAKSNWRYYQVECADERSAVTPSAARPCYYQKQHRQERRQQQRI